MTGGPDAVLVVGEALIDLVPVPGDRNARLARFGGAPANVAAGLARLGTPAAFAGGLGGDGFALLIEERLREAGADLSLCGRCDRPTALAVAEPGTEGTRYHFHLQDTATFRLPDRSARAARFGAVYVGGLAAVVEPAAGTVRATALAAAEHSLLVVDPNVRENPTAAGNGGLDALRELCALAHVVKVSDEDMARLRPDTTPADACRKLADGGRLVVLTRGARGSTAYAPGREPVSVPAAPVDVVSTIGAGDAFVAGMLAWLGDHRSFRADVTAEQARSMLSFASGVAGSVCAGEAGAPRVPART